jgi:hypothetical protein
MEREPGGDTGEKRKKEPGFLQPPFLGPIQHKNQVPPAGHPKKFNGFLSLVPLQAKATLRSLGTHLEVSVYFFAYPGQSWL